MSQAQKREPTSTHEAARNALFKNGKPDVRYMTLEDMQWLWAAYKLSGGDLSQEEFSEQVAEEMVNYDRLYIVEDENYRFEGKRGPIGLFTALYDGWNIEPHVEFFPWASPRNKMRTVAGFLMFLRQQKDIGCVRIHSSEESRPLFKKLSKYVPIKVGGKINRGRPDGPDYLFYVVGRSKGIRHE